jgi:antitoxin HicB
MVIRTENEGMAGNMYIVEIERDEDGIYVASAPALPGCYTQGGTRAEAMQNIRDAIKLYIAARKALGEPVPCERAVGRGMV